MIGTSDGAEVSVVGTEDETGGNTGGKIGRDGSSGEPPGGADRDTKDGSEEDKCGADGAVEEPNETGGPGVSGNNGGEKETASSEEDEGAKVPAEGAKTGSTAGTSDASTSTETGRGDS